MIKDTDEQFKELVRNRMSVLTYEDAIKTIVRNCKHPVIIVTLLHCDPSKDVKNIKKGLARKNQIFMNCTEVLELAAKIDVWNMQEKELKKERAHGTLE